MKATLVWALSSAQADADHPAPGPTLPLTTLTTTGRQPGPAANPGLTFAVWRCLTCSCWWWRRGQGGEHWRPGPDRRRLPTQDGQRLGHHHQVVRRDHPARHGPPWPARTLAGGRARLFGGDPPGREQGQHRDPASTTRAARSPSSLACWLASRTVGGGLLTHVCLVERGLEVGVDERHAASELDVGLGFDRVGDLASWIPVRNELVRRRSGSTRPGLPIEAPRLVPVFRSPPTSGLSWSGPPTPSRCPAGRPAPRCPAPASSSGMVTISAPAAGRCWRTGPRCRPAWPAARGDDSRGETLGRNRGMPAAANSRVSDRAGS